MKLRVKENATGQEFWCYGFIYAPDYDKTFAVLADDSGSMTERPIELLTVLNQ